MVRASYDPEADAMFVWLAPAGTKSASTTEIAPGIMLDYDEAGNVIGIEVLDVPERVAEQRGNAPGYPVTPRHRGRPLP